MLNKNTIQTMQQLEEAINGLLEQIPGKAGAEAVGFFTANFRRQGWVYDGKMERWLPRKNAKDTGRAILIKSGRLWRSIRISEQSTARVVIGTDVPYAQVHNEGLRVTTTQHVRPFTRNYRGERIAVRGHERRINTQYPRRQFIGESPDVMKTLDRWLFQQILDIIERL